MQRAREPRAGRRPLVDPPPIDWSHVTALVISPGIPSRLPKPHPLAAAARAAGSDDLRHRAAGPRAAESALRRHHRHQRQVDHHGADRPHPRPAPAALRGRRQYRPRRARPRAARSARHLCAGAVVLPARAARDLPRRCRGLLNITPDHLDRHGDMAGYVAAKGSIFARQRRATAPSSASTTSPRARSSGSLEARRASPRFR